MIAYALLAGLVIVLGIAVIGKVVQASPATVATALRRIGGVMLLAIAGLAAMRGSTSIAVPLFLTALGLLGLGLAGRGFANWRKSAGQRSKVATGMLSMELDHDTGNMDGEVLGGTFVGRRLGELDLEDLMALRRECLSSPDQSTQLLDAYLDRYHRGWRGEGDGRNRKNPSTSAMTREEALSVLGLREGASEQDIRSAHRRLMKKFHPDHDGSDWLAARLNEAKDVLLG